MAGYKEVIQLDGLLLSPTLTGQAVSIRAFCAKILTGREG